MSRPKNVTLESFDPQILDLLREATSQPIRIDVPPGTNPFKHIARFRHFASLMREEKHPLAQQVARIAIRWDQAGSAIILESRDEGLRELTVRRLDGTPLTPYAEAPLPGPDPLEDPDFGVKRDPFAAYMKAPEAPIATRDAFDSNSEDPTHG